MDGRKVKVLSSSLRTMLVLLAVTSCGAPRYDAATVEGKAAVVDAVNAALTDKDCASAIATIEPVYGSVNTDNEIRMARASAQGCAAGIPSYYGFTGKLLLRAADLAGPKFWEVMTELFYGTTQTEQDTQITAAWSSTDALMATLFPGTVIAKANRVNSETPNVGSVIATNRLDDANLYLIFISMAAVGNLQNRYGAPSNTFKRSIILGAASAADTEGWTKASKVNEAGCSYAASLVNLIDAITATSGKMDAKLGDSFKSVSSTFGTLINNACDAGCRGESVDGLNYNVTGCTFNTDNLCKGTSTRPCQILLRNRESCTDIATVETDDRARCAAAGIANLVSRHPSFGWLTQ